MSINIYDSTFILIYCCVLSFILGSVFGSFLNCVASRIQEGIPWWKGKSVCDHCHHELSILDLFPIFSYLFLKGKCRYCGSKLSIKYVFTEVILGLLFVICVLLHKTIDIELLDYLGMICVLYGLSLCDINTYEIPDGFIIFGIIWALIFQLLEGYTLLEVGTSILIAVCVSGIILLISLILDKILKKESMGGGDIKLLFLTGLYLSLLGNLLEMMIACILGLVIIIVLKKDKIPFGPSISLAWYITILVGNTVINWYISTFIGL